LKNIAKIIEIKKYRKIILWALTFGVLTVGAAVHELYSSYQAEIKRAQVQSDNLSMVLEQQLSVIFTKFNLTMSETVRSLQNENLIEKKNKEKINHLLNERHQDIAEAKTMYILDKNGYDVLRTKDNKPLYLGDREYFYAQKNSTENSFYISQPLVGRISGIPSLVFSRKIFDKNKQFNGIVGVTIPLVYFRDIFSKLDVGKEGTLSLGSNEDMIYAHMPWKDNYVGKKFNESTIINKIFSGNTNFIRLVRPSIENGSTQYLSVRRVGDTKLYVYVGISKNEVLASWKYRSLFYFFSFLCLWTCGGIYMFRFLKSLYELDERKKHGFQNAKLASLGEMASGIAHEINNPLAVIHSRTLQLKRQIDRNQYDPEAFKENLQKINITVDRIAKIIRGLKSFSRNADEDEFVAVPMSTIIENTLELCSEKFRNRNVLLKVDPIPDITIDCRESQLVQVLLNLLMNGFDAVENLEDRWVHISFKLVKKGAVSILVTDSGTGIPEAIAQNIMQPFYTTKEVGKGTGLGLSISKGIINNHRGEIYLDRKCMQTRFVIDLPIRQINYETLNHVG
jgi:C4-dicarboxylate-specific signal transduction histidine kinase